MRPPVEILRELYAYDPETGIITYRENRGRFKAGTEAGSINNDGYRVVKILHDGKRTQIMSHVVAWALHHGMYPVADIDHDNRVRTDNWIKNLRDASRSNNLANRANKGPLPKGVTFDKRNKKKPYKAQSKFNKINKYLGNYACPNEAHEVYMAHAKTVFGEFASP